LLFTKTKVDFWMVLLLKKKTKNTVQEIKEASVKK